MTTSCTLFGQHTTVTFGAKVKADAQHCKSAQAAMRAADGTLSWEAGADRAIVVPPGAAAEVEVIVEVKMPW